MKIDILWPDYNWSVLLWIINICANSELCHKCQSKSSAQNKQRQMWPLFAKMPPLCQVAKITALKKQTILKEGNMGQQLYSSCSLASFDDKRDLLCFFSTSTSNKWQFIINGNEFEAQSSLYKIMYRSTSPWRDISCFWDLIWPYK